MYHNILVPLDSSPCSKAAVLVAGRLSRAWGSHLSFVHILSDVSEKYRKEARAMLEQYAQQTRYVPQLLLESSTQGIAQTLAGIAEREASELVIIGTHAHATLERQAIGSIAHDLAVLAQTPVLIVPAQFRKHGFEARWAHFPNTGGNS